ncbi:hypothetical protein JAAARDRAFT_187994 [Jaapia argillacea MUCL 33604]|uniref:Zona occludens toxin N-terminal domain-containing protein n=1 Tax=Jaapia argillacea MUCL 33604 TaxID=933084 RepID=A0A067QES8_9AGAM|nr:hypothetical protein JAAARDRAFT_187994 [Jaapia argillacea MUCL 33604]
MSTFFSIQSLSTHPSEPNPCSPADDQPSWALSDDSSHGSSANSGEESILSVIDGDEQELVLLDKSCLELTGEEESLHGLRTAPLMTRAAFCKVQARTENTQYGVLGVVTAIQPKTDFKLSDNNRLYLNINTPFSAIVCGVQGSGKSHTVSVMLENMLIPDYRAIGVLQNPLCGLVLHFGEGGPTSKPCEAAFVGMSDLPLLTPRIKVYVSRSSLKTMRDVYSSFGERVVVEPLLLGEGELDAQSFLSMMAVSSSEAAPLYVQTILSILRDLGESFTYRRFKVELDSRTFNPMQMSGLKQRMALLESFMDKDHARQPQAASRFSSGQLTIIDLSDPFVDPAAACGLFEIMLRLFVRADVGTGKVLVVDEAHKYISAQKGSSGLVKSLLSLTRQQRHLGMRVIVSTQEPTVVHPIVLDLCNVAILHRFSSPTWWTHLEKHVSADFSDTDAFDKVVKLKTGEAIVLAPSGLGVVRDGADDGTVNGNTGLREFGRRYLLMKTRRRVTADGGASVMAMQD